MAQDLELQNFGKKNILEVTGYAADAAAGASTLTVQNNDSIATDSFLVLGKRGAEQAELARVASVSGTTITLTGGTQFAHKQFEQVTRLFANQSKVYRATNVNGTVPADTAFAEVATVDLDVDDLTTLYTDGSGGAGFWYKQTYFNSVTFAESDLAYSDAIRGGDFGHYVTLEDIRIEAGFQDNSDVDDVLISTYRNYAESIVNGALTNGSYVLPLSSIPSVVRDITRQLAAGMLLTREYGPGANATNREEGKTKKDEARALLDQVRHREVPLLDDNTLAPLATKTLFDGWPDSSTETADDTAGGGSLKFWMNQKL